MSDRDPSFLSATPYSTCKQGPAAISVHTTHPHTTTPTPHYPPRHKEGRDHATQHHPREKETLNKSQGVNGFQRNQIKNYISLSTTSLDTCNLKKKKPSQLSAHPKIPTTFPTKTSLTPSAIPLTNNISTTNNPTPSYHTSHRYRKYTRLRTLRHPPQPPTITLPESQNYPPRGSPKHP